MKRGRLGDDALRAWWNELWAVGHLSVLANMDSRDVITELPAEAPERGLLLWPAVRQGVVAVVWLVDPVLRTLEVLRLEGGRWMLLDTHHDDARVRAEVFELELDVLWAGVQLAAPPR